MSAKEKVFITKMSVKTLECKPATVNMQGVKAPYALCHIYGTANGVKLKEENDGRISSALIGTFEGLNLATGDLYASGKLYLPGGIHETVEAAVRTQVEVDEIVDGKPTGKKTVKVEEHDVEFALEIRSVPASNPIGYSYQAVSLIKPREADALATLRAQIQERMDKALLIGSGQTEGAKALPPATKKR